ncbi:MAG: ATP phosphoribosyltransferase regulatory subunit, partial [Alphaproteobacteria bacterium]|nr:ATP phosphoribosyltransferase regulatory subunit [Alphaproteobacteria bacterium]
ALKAYFRQHREALSEESIRRLKSNPLRILDSKAEQDRALFVNAPIIDDFLATPSRERFTLLCTALDELGIVFTRDRHLVRGLDYYEHTTFEFITNALGTQGTVLGGGCYDRLFEIVGGKAATGVGFAAGIERLAELIIPPALPAVQCALIPIGTTAEAATPALARYLREAGIATVFGFSGKVTARMRQADQMAARFCVIYGETEVVQHQVKLKDMRSGDEATMTTKAMRDALVRQLKIQQHG